MVEELARSPVTVRLPPIIFCGAPEAELRPCAPTGPPELARFAVHGMLAAPRTVLAPLKAIGSVLLALGGGVIPPLALGAREGDDLTWHGDRPPWTRRAGGPRDSYSRILLTTPAPTVRPPSRIANRCPSSSATGVISAASIVTLSPGITISTPSGSLMSPVTSVVRK